MFYKIDMFFHMDRVIIKFLVNLPALNVFGVRDPLLDLVRDYGNRGALVAFAPVALCLSPLPNHSALLPE